MVRSRRHDTRLRVATTIPNPSVAASTQATQDALTNAIAAAVEKYQSAAKSATSGPLKVLDTEAANQIRALGQQFKAQASGESGPTLKQTVSEFQNALTALEAKVNPGIKNAATLEAIHMELTKAGDKYKAAAQSATTPLLAALDTHFANLIGAIKVDSPSQKLEIEKRVQAIQTQASVQVGLGSKGTSLLSTMTNDTNSTSYRSLVDDTNKIHKAALDQLVKELDATHNKALQGLAANLESTFKVEERTKNAIVQADNKTIQTDAAHQQVTLWMDASDEAVQAIKDMSQSIQDSFAAAATAITDASTLMTDAANAQSTTIADNAQTTVDTLAERGLYGLNLIAQQATVAGDKQKTAYDAQIAAAQSAVDTAQQTGNQAQAAQQAIVDSTTSQQNALVQAAQAHVNEVTATQNVLIDQRAESGRSWQGRRTSTVEAR